MSGPPPRVRTSRLYLDIDGVLNVAHPRTGSADWADWERIGVGYAPVVVSRAMLAGVFGLPVDEVVWATTWEEDADRVFAAALGIRRGLRHLRLGDGWKREAIAQDLAGRPVDRFVWVDDAEAHETNLAWIAERVVGEGLAVRPRPGAGLTRADLASIRAFLT